MSPSGKPEILAIGEPLIEMVRLPEPVSGRPAYVQGFGGDTSTAMIAAARQGGRAGYLTAVGDDMFGRALCDLWDREEVDRAGVRVRPGDPTGICFIDPDPQNRRFTYARRGSAASLYGPADLPEDAIAGARVLHLSGITLAISDTMRMAARRAVEIARTNGVIVSLDINFRPALWPREKAAGVIMDIAKSATIIFPSDDESEMLLGTKDADAIADTFLGLGATIVAVKCGAAGSYLVHPDRRESIPAAPAIPVDSAGAGDTFAGTFLAWYLETSDASRAARQAAIAAAGTVSGFGAVEPIPRRVRD